MNHVSSRKTVSDLKHQRKKDMLDHYLVHFTVPKLTFYRRKLPKFLDDETWKRTKWLFLNEVRSESQPEKEIEGNAEIPIKSDYITQDMKAEARLKNLIKQKKGYRISKMLQYKVNKTYKDLPQLIIDEKTNSNNSLPKFKSNIEQSTQGTSSIFKRKTKYISESTLSNIRAPRIVTGAFTGTPLNYKFLIKLVTH